MLNPIMRATMEDNALTFMRLEFDPASGVPSLFSTLLCLAAAASSRIGRRWFRSAYLRHEMPHASHKTGVGKPFGAFHHCLVSRVRQAPHDACALLGVRTIEPSESESSAEGAAYADGGGVFVPSRRRLRLSSLSFLLFWSLKESQIEEKRGKIWHRTFSSARNTARPHRSCVCQLHRERYVVQRRGYERHPQTQPSRRRPTHGQHTVFLRSSTGTT